MKRPSQQHLYAALAVCAVLSVPALARPQAAAPQHDADELHIQQDAFATPLPFDRGAAGLAQSLRKLSTRASMLQINAHPDDEDGATLAYVSRGLGATVSLLSLNRGEGGQNVMTPEFWDGLGILRTQEHLTANHYYGVNLYYTRVADFGFSKTREETLRQWGHERVLGDAVRVVRETRPMVLTSVFAGNSSDGHGHHQTAGVTTQEVYTAAGDPKMFPEQMKEGLLPWTPLKVYARAPFGRVTGKTVYDYATGKTEPLLYRNYVTGETMDYVPPATVTVPGGTYNALFGESYAQVSREGLNQQKSQNGGVPIPPPGRADASYHLYASRVSGAKLPDQEATFFDGIDTSLPAIAGYLPAASQAPVRTQLSAIDAQVKEATARFDGNDPSKSAPALAKGLDLTRALIADLRKAKLPEDARYNAIFELETKERQLNEALAQSLGMNVIATVQNAPGGPQQMGPGGPPQATVSQTVVAGENFGVNVHVSDQGETPVTIDNITLVPSLGGDWKVHSPQPEAASQTPRRTRTRWRGPTTDIDCRRPWQPPGRRTRRNLGHGRPHARRHRDRRLPFSDGPHQRRAHRPVLLTAEPGAELLRPERPTLPDVADRAVPDLRRGELHLRRHARHALRRGADTAPLQRSGHPAGAVTDCAGHLRYRVACKRHPAVEQYRPAAAGDRAQQCERAGERHAEA